MTLYLLNKPFQTLCQFSSSDEKEVTLANWVKIPNIYPAGRLDKDSEGLLLLTDDGKLQHKISHPKHKWPKTYWVQVEGEPTAQALNKLRDGITLKDGATKPCKVKIIEEPVDLWARTPPIRFRQNQPTSWLQITLKEGRNRQVRRMTAAIGHPTLRLIRYAIGPYSLDSARPRLAPGEYIDSTKFG